jgi:integrase
MRDLLYELKQLTQRAREGSYATQANRKAILHQMGEQLIAAGFQQLHAYDLKGRHVHALLRQWQGDGLSPSTQKNRMSVLRWWAAHIGKADMLKATNDAYGIAKRQPIPTVSKARQLSPEGLSRVQNAYVRMSLELQRAFGLRRQEAIKLKPHEADHGTELALQGSWCKGGQPRTIPLETPAQREVLDRAKALARFHNASLIPKHKTYAQQLHSYEGHCRRANLDKMHGLRHAYAQERFAVLAGFLAPKAGGPSRGQLTPMQRQIDEDVRLMISAEMGHHREAITAVYLGR